MITEKYPDAYDVIELVNLRSTSQANIREFTARKGILVAGRGKETHGVVLSRLLLDHRGYLALRYYAQGGGAKASISGFNMRTWSTPDKTVQDIRHDIMNLRDRMAEQKQLNRKSLSVELNIPELHGNTLLGRYTYQRVVPGKVVLLARSNEQVDYAIMQVRSDIWRVVCLPKYNTDVETLQNILSKADKIAYEMFSISLDGFPVSDRIAYFDRILDHYSHASTAWRLKEVCGIVVRNSQEKLENDEEDVFDIENEADLDEVINEDKSVKRVKDSDLRSITEAALEGNNLRTNSFVRDCERAGFYFSSISMELESLSGTEVIRVKLRFKLSPKMFEAVLLQTWAQSEIGRQELRFTPEREQEILSDFWTTSHEIWHEMKDNIPAVLDGSRQVVINFDQLTN